MQSAYYKTSCKLHTAYCNQITEKSSYLRVTNYRFKGVPSSSNIKRGNSKNNAIVDVTSREHLTIHVVGARTAEVQDVTIWEILPLRLPNLRYLTIVFIGPELK